MAQHDYHLAQINIGRTHAPLDDPSMQEFVQALAPINALADATPGFVGRLQTEAGNATDLQVFDDQTILINMSVWENITDLKAFTYKSQHAQFLRRRKEWFKKFDGAILALWWVPAGHIPTIEEARLRLAHLEQHGETPYAFTFRQTFLPEAAVR